MSCIFFCVSKKKNVKSAKVKLGPSSVSNDEIRAHREECRENKKAFVEKYPNSRQAQVLHQVPLRTAPQVQEDILRAMGPFKKSERPLLDTKKDHRRVTSKEAALARSHAKALRRTSRTALDTASESTCFIPIGKLESQQLVIRSKGLLKYQEATMRAASEKKQRGAPIMLSTRPEKVISDVGMIKSRPATEGFLETRIGQKIVQSTEPLTPATIRTIALYPDAWDATKGVIDREGLPIKKIMRYSSDFEKEARDPLPPKAKSATAHKSR